MTVASVEEVIDHYRHCRHAIHPRPIRRPNAHEPEDHAVATSYLRWCVQREVDALYFITDRMSYVWRTQKRLVQFRAMRCEPCLPSYRSHEYQWRLAQASQSAARTQETPMAQLVRDLGLFMVSHEHVRARYYREQHPELCRVSTRDTGGFDPRSRFCPTCTEAPVCAAELKRKWGFNVVALRSGQFEQLPIPIANLAKRQHGISV